MREQTWCSLPLLGQLIQASGMEKSMKLYKHLGTAAGIIPMLIYVIMGLWLDSFLIWVRLGITALIVLGLLVSGNYFWIWMAIVCEGGLVGTGLFIRRKWRAE